MRTVSSVLGGHNAPPKSSTPKPCCVPDGRPEGACSAVDGCNCSQARQAAYTDARLTLVAYNALTMEHMIASATTTPSRVRPDIITDEFLATLRQHDVVRAFLFGSVARGDERPDSDIDLLVTFGLKAEPGEQFLLAEALFRLTGRRVDVATNLHPAFAPFIQSTLMPLPL